MSKHRLFIEDLSLLKITKITDYKIYFTYKSESYFILHSYNLLNLYKREIKNNKVTIDLYKSIKVISGFNIRYLYRDISLVITKNKVYNNIDREHFVKKLTEIDLIDSLYSREYTELQSRINEIDAQIQKLSAEKHELYRSWSEFHNMGSKKCNESKFKIQAANRIKGKAYGEYCEQYNTSYGSTHSVYGGVLTDLFSLPIGTHFHCTNGDWDGIIWYNNKGNKCVITGKNMVEINENNKNLYINIYKEDE